MAFPSNVSNVTHSSGKTLISFNASQSPLKLTSQNYPTWRAQVVPVLLGYNLIGYVNRTLLPPSPIIQKDGKDVRNDDYGFWVCQDQMILAAIIASTSFSAMHITSFAGTSADAWLRLQISFANRSAMRILSLREKLSNLKLESKSVSDYLQTVKTISKDLALSGSPVSIIDLVIYVLNRIETEFKDIAAAVWVRDSIISFEELEDKLLAHCISREWIPPMMLFRSRLIMFGKVFLIGRTHGIIIRILVRMVLSVLRGFGHLMTRIFGPLHQQVGSKIQC